MQSAEAAILVRTLSARLTRAVSLAIESRGSGGWRAIAQLLAEREAVRAESVREGSKLVKVDWLFALRFQVGVNKGRVTHVTKYATHPARPTVRSP